MNRIHRPKRIRSSFSLNACRCFLSKTIISFFHVRWQESRSFMIYYICSFIMQYLFFTTPACLTFNIIFGLLAHGMAIHSPWAKSGLPLVFQWPMSVNHVFYLLCSEALTPGTWPSLSQPILRDSKQMSTPFRYKPTSWEPTTPTTPLLGFHTPGHNPPAFITPGPGTR